MASVLAWPVHAQDSAAETNAAVEGMAPPAAQTSPTPLPPIAPLPEEEGLPLLESVQVAQPELPDEAVAPASQSLPVLATPAHAPISPGRYCAKEPVSGVSGDGEQIALGDFLMWVEVSENGGAHGVSFSNSLPDSEEVLAAESDNAFLLPDGSLTFVFTDGWGNKGRARLYPTGLIDLEVVERARGNQVTRNYGSFFVFKGGCAEPEFETGQ